MNKEMASDLLRMDPQQEAVLVELILEEKAKSPLNATTLANQQWQSISRELQCRTGIVYIEEYLKGKYYRLRNDWKLYRDLRENNTGVGWDPATGAIVASEQQWKHWQSKSKEYRKFRYKGLAQYNELTTIFGTFTATGDYGIHVEMAPTNSNEERMIEDDFRGCQPFSTKAWIDDGILDDGVSGSHVCRHSRKSRNRPIDASGDSTGGRSSKKTRSNSIEVALDAWTTRQLNLDAKFEDDVTITECMELLLELNVDDTLFMKAIQHLRDPTNRVFFKRSTPDKRLLILGSLP